ncbi:hypothetical protein KEM48_005462 [Puccinia striiformis f. sp. tritici PST-130]|nr:hypothetical protein KEM48_005462 [Puccinia striiformis f. sp. tritici PST-130]
MEQKTNPRNRLYGFTRIGLTPDLIAARCSEPLERSVASKIRMFCHVGPDQVCLSRRDPSTSPLFLKNRGLIRSYLNDLISVKLATFREEGSRNKEYHAAWVALCSAEGILVPGGFGVRGTEGMMAAAKWRERSEYRSWVSAWLPNPSSRMGPKCVWTQRCPIYGVKRTQRSQSHLHARDLKDDWSAIKAIYGGSEVIWERHRHRYEVNPEYIDRLEVNGFRFTGKDSKGLRMQVAELEDGPKGIPQHPDTRPQAGHRTLTLTTATPLAPNSSSTELLAEMNSPPPPPHRKKRDEHREQQYHQQRPSSQQDERKQTTPKKEKPAPVTMVYRGAPDHQQYTMNPSVTALAPQTAINRGYGCYIDVPPPSTAAPSYSLTHATEASLMKRKHNRLRDLCRERGLLSPSRELTKREMVQGLLTWREANIGQRSSGSLRLTTR